VGAHGFEPRTLPT